MFNGVTSLATGGHAPKIGSVGIWGDYDQYKYSSWLGTADATLATFAFGGEGAAGTKAVEGIEGLEGATEVEAATSTVVRDAAESCLNSFTGDTPVLMADGTEKAIADVKIGDKVLATDPETGVSKANPVTALIRHGGKHTMVEFTLADSSVLTSTDHHPIWDATTTTFTDAINLRVGEDLLGANGQLLAITGERIYDQDLTAYNLQFDGIHTYYAGNTPVLVHNSCEDVFIDDALRTKLETQHTAGGSDVGPDQSTFNRGLDFDDLAACANGVACTSRADGWYERDVDYGSIVGTVNSTGLPTTWFRVVQDGYGVTRTIYPIPGS